MFITDKCARCTAALRSARAPRVEKNGTQTYAVIGVSGQRAGSLQRVGPADGGMWELQMYARPREMIRYFKDAKAEAIEQAKRY